MSFPESLRPSSLSYLKHVQQEQEEEEQADGPSQRQSRRARRGACARTECRSVVSLQVPLVPLVIILNRVVPSSKPITSQVSPNWLPSVGENNGAREGSIGELICRQKVLRLCAPFPHRKHSRLSCCCQGYT
jgi:hypothetical protein